MKLEKLVFLIPILCVCLIATGCPSTNSPGTSGPTVTPAPQPKEPESSKRSYDPEKHIKDNTVAELRDDESVRVSKNVVEPVPEIAPGERVDINPETKQEFKTYMRVEGAQFNDQDLLKGVRYRITETARNNNYWFEEEEATGRKGFAFKLRSDLTPISLYETIVNSLDIYGDKIDIKRKNDELILITEN